jgi:hypothetical protein
MELANKESFFNEVCTEFPPELLGAVWHTTSISRFKRIVSSREIMAEPDIADTARHGTRRGPKLYPFVRSLGGISVFDFQNFDPAEHFKETGALNWPHFVFGHHTEEDSLWIEINTKKLNDSYLSAKEIRHMWHESNSNRKFMTGIEGAVLKSVPIDAFRNVLLFSKRDQKFSNLIIK